ncbi:MAG: DUF4835 family protein [Urechidicola sp.]|jgi:hypothetical protein
MNRYIQVLVVLLFSMQLTAQEINATVTINSDNVSGSNKQVYQTLERSLTEYINQKKWTENNFKIQERIQCAFTLTILDQPSSNEFVGNIQIQSTRPIYNTSYLTPIFNFKDDDFSFQYTEFEILQYNKNNFESNLVSIVTFYVYSILGMDADSFTNKGGTEYYKQAEGVVNQAQQSSYIGWSQTDRGPTRFRLINDILSGAYDNYRTSLYNYHRNGLDIMSDDKKDAKDNISETIQLLRDIYNRRPNSLLVRTFMDSKADEIVEIFSDGPRFNADKLKESLIKMSPVNMSKWDKIQ